MSQLARFLAYAREFEVAQATDDFSRIEPFFAADARHRVDAAGPLAADDRDRAAVVGGLRACVHEVDRRFDVRIPEVLEGPLVRDDGIWMRFGLTLRRGELPDLVLEGEHLAVYDERGDIARIDEKMLGGCDETARAYLERHDAALRPRGSAPAAPRAQHLPLLRDALQRTLVRAYGAAKSRQDAEAALSICHESFGIETVPFGLSSGSRDETAAQLALFFSVFPDYRAETEAIVADDAGAAWWGRISLTFAGPLLGHEPTHRRAELPAFSAFEFRDGLLARERFMFDLGALCEGIGLDAVELSAALRTLRGTA